MIKQELEILGVKITFIDLGELIVDEANSNQEEILSQIEKVLYSNNFEIFHSSEDVLVEKIKHFLFNKTEVLPLNMTVNLSQVLGDELNHNYKSLSKLFSSSEKITIEKYFIRSKIEKSKG